MYTKLYAICADVHFLRRESKFFIQFAKGSKTHQKTKNYQVELKYTVFESYLILQNIKSD